ncbi:hypothetical protein [Streptomyces sp. NPDC005989]|uniref:hypothetical protein n=1 Tax=unclassified Streptomyces TaxID=2593676 RepID=UPI0033CB7876
MADQPTSEEQPTADEGVQQIPAVIRVEQPPAAADARDALLAAIGAQAQAVADKSAGQASAALVELARAYALVAFPAAAKARVVRPVVLEGLTSDLSGPVKSSACSAEAGTAKAVMFTSEEVGLWGGADYARNLATTATGLGTPNTGEQAATVAGSSEGIQQAPATITMAEVPAAADARNKLFAALGAEAQQMTDKSAGQASAALAELAHAYALVAGDPAAATPLPVTGRSMTVLPLDSKNSATLLVTPS